MNDLPLSSRPALLAALACVFSVTDLGHPEPDDDEFLFLLGDAERTRAHASTLVFQVCAPYIEDEAHEDIWSDLAAEWADQLADKDQERIERTWPWTVRFFALAAAAEAGAAGSSGSGAFALLSGLLARS
jgi:hypothetical protein